MNFLKKTILLITLFLLTNCSKTILNHGYMFDDKLVSKLQIGFTTKSQVKELLGNPSTDSEFGNKIWYYISSKSEKLAFFEPKIIHRKILLVEFNEGEIVKNLSEFDLNNAQYIELVKEITATRGDDTRILRQFMDNFGRFNKKNRNKNPKK